MHIHFLKKLFVVSLTITIHSPLAHAMENNKTLPKTGIATLRKLTKDSRSSSRSLPTLQDADSLANDSSTAVTTTPQNNYSSAIKVRHRKVDCVVRMQSLDKLALFNENNWCDSKRQKNRDLFIAIIKGPVGHEHCDFCDQSESELGDQTLCDFCTQVKKLLDDKEVDINARNHHQRTPLHIAVKYNRFGVVKLLVKLLRLESASLESASFDEKDCYGCTPLDLAIKNTFLEKAIKKEEQPEKIDAMRAKNNDIIKYLTDFHSATRKFDWGQST